MLLHRYFIQDNSVLEIKDFQLNAGIEIYEVIRILEGVPLFLEDHLKRFYHSAWLCHLEIPVEGHEIRAMLRKLVEINGIKEGNVRFSWCFGPGGFFQAYFIPCHYPDIQMVKKGVYCGLLQAERNDPNAKVVQVTLRDAADQMIRENGFYEVLLVNQRGAITEGSRSNVFFLKKGVFFTSPEEDILPGITRQKVLELISGLGMKVIYKTTLINELTQVESSFLTGTSPKVLPVRRIGDISLTVGQPELNELVMAYNEMIGDYIKNNR